MNLGSPVVFRQEVGQRRFDPLVSISMRRDDPNAFDETVLQELIDATPNVLPVREYLPSATTLFSLAREVPVDLGANQGFIDNLLVTNDAYLVIVETKLHRNPEGIRDVIAQTLQYGTAVGQMPLMELESRIKRGQSPALKGGESIRECVVRQASEQNRPATLAENFEEALESHLRRGEVLLLIVSDGIHVGVERVTHWLNEQGTSSPFKFGLVQLKCYKHGTDMLVVPRTVLKTREVSRHVVVVDIRPSLGISASAEVMDDFQNDVGGRVQESRQVRTAAPPLTRQELMQLIAPEDQSSAALLFDAFEAYPFSRRGFGSSIQVGFNYPSDSSDFHPLAYMYKGGVWAYPLTALSKVLGQEAVVAFHQEANKFARFYREDQMDKPGSTGLQVRYPQLREKVNEFAAFIDAYRVKAIELLEAGSQDQ